MLRLLLFLARVCGKLSALLIRRQTALLTRAQEKHGWEPSTHAQRVKLAQRQFQLAQYNELRETLRQIKRAGGPVR